ncbi:hypothetical protein jhhlp_000310 [Lomentospora prolificans]|uniref:Uncharacterized protein n=1 Tax=Lomentospora prolificans TaxID=41688 RepID=A0A2N3NKL9_9PEZI|nr:hypothetical protein jhhlp_000310 [Lomentospora prolificans]
MIGTEDDYVPAYEENGQRFADWTESLDSNTLGLPLTQHPFAGGVCLPQGFTPEELDRRDTQAIIFTRFFQAITTKNLDVVTLMVSNGLISPCAVNMNGETPLINAVQTGNMAVVRSLVALGADVSEFGRYKGAERTPLQVAADNGFLPAVKFFMEECGADDGVIAPDGQLALRLAAAKDHREVVDYLPSRRGGGWLRWKTEHSVLMRRVRKARRRIFRVIQFLVWDLPEFFLYTIPKHGIVIPIKRKVKYAIENRHLFGGWCKRQALAFPGRVKRCAQAVGHGLRKIPRAIASVLKWLWRTIKAAPGRIKNAAVVVGRWFADVARRFGRAVAYVFTQILSVLHTLSMAVITFFRQITLKDVWNGFCGLMRAVFVGLPQAVWAGIKALGETSYDVLKALFGLFGMAVWWIIRIIWYILQYVPAQIVTIIASFGKSIAKAFKEVMVWYDPKRV